jgi:hypothetical protein
MKRILFHILGVLLILSLLIVPSLAIPGAANATAYENFTAYTEVDSGGDITVTSSNVSWDTMDRGATSYVCKDYGIGHFGDFEQDLTINLSYAATWAIQGFWSLSNISNPTYSALYNAASGFGLFMMDGVTLHLSDYDVHADNDDTMTVTIPFTYYVTFQRIAYILTCSLYSDSGRTVLVDTLSIHCTDTTFRYLGVGNSGQAGSAQVSTGYSENLDLQEAGVSAPTVVTGVASAITQNTANVSGNCTVTGGADVTSWGAQYGTSTAYSSGNITHNGTQSSIFSWQDALSGLPPNTLIHYRSWARNSADINYGADGNFTTLAVVPPTVTAQNADNVTDISATLHGNVIDTGGANVTMRLAQWGTLAGGVYTNSVNETGDWGTGNFTLQATGLSPGVAYIFRTGATNSAGTAWSDEGDWTGIVPPTVTISAATSVEVVSARVHGDITATGGQDCEVNFYLGTTDGGTDPESWDRTFSPSQSQPQGVASFWQNVFSLQPGTIYHVRASANNTAGTNWTDDITFLTKPATPDGVTATKGDSTENVTINWAKSFGADGYDIYRNDILLDSVGDVNIYTDTTAAAPIITAGSVLASDGSSNINVPLSLPGASIADGTTYTYNIVATNASGNSTASAGDTGYRGHGDLTYQWYISSGDSNGDYSLIGGATDSTYIDDTSPAGIITPGTPSASDNTSTSYVTLTLSGHSVAAGEGRFWKCVLDTTGALQQTSTANRGYKGVGALTIQWQSSLINISANFTNIVGGITNPFNDTTAPADGTLVYYRAKVDADGAAQATSTVDSGYRNSTIATVSILDNFPGLRPIVAISGMIIFIFLIVISGIGQIGTGLYLFARDNWWRRK